jgi:hypothetical protein
VYLGTKVLLQFFWIITTQPQETSNISFFSYTTAHMEIVSTMVMYVCVLKTKCANNLSLKGDLSQVAGNLWSNTEAWAELPKITTFSMTISAGTATSGKKM